jgi:hypothetical protein
MDVIRLWSYLTLVDYPASKVEVVDVAARAGAPQGMIEFVQSVHGERYVSPEALQVAIQTRLNEPVAPGV